MKIFIFYCSLFVTMFSFSCESGWAAMKGFCGRHRLVRDEVVVALKPERALAAAPVMQSRTGYGKPYPLITSSNPSVQPFVGITYRTPAD